MHQPSAIDGEVKQIGETFQRAFAEIGRLIVGQRHICERLAMAMMAEGHVLLEGLPGLAKTSIVKAFAQVTSLGFKRIQFTPDLLPADVIGTQIYDPRAANFYVRRGPVFTNVLLADEINRAPAKVQSALLEAMQERQVTIGDESFNLPRPFLVLATQNPIEQEGTYPLPEAQVDRFLFKVQVRYGNAADELEMMRRLAAQDEPVLEKVLSEKDLEHARQVSRQIHVADKVRKYIVDLVMTTREPKKHGCEDLALLIEVGASPRASLNLERAARLNALLDGRSFVTPQDVKDIGLDVLRHRLILSYEAEADRVTSEDVVQRIFERVDVP